MEKIEYRLVRSSRKTVSIQIEPGGEVIVRAPARMSAAEIERMVDAKRGWIEKHIPRKVDERERLNPEEIQELADRAAKVIPERVEYFAPLVGVGYGRIAIRHQRTRWGSCSGKGNLNFNCLLMLAPAEVLDYVVVHELCHRKEMNHSARFWAEVERVLPDWKERRRWLREHGQVLMARMIG